MSENSIYILLTDTGTWFSRMIKFYTKAPYNHVSIALDEGLNRVYSFGRKAYINPFSAGFVKERMDKGVFFHKRETRCAIYKLTVNEIQYENVIRIVHHFESFPALYKYNLIGVFAIALNMKVKRKNAYTCSQFVASVLKMSNVHLFKKCPELIRPDDFSELLHLQLFYEGKLHEYSGTKEDYPFTSIGLQL